MSTSLGTQSARLSPVPACAGQGQTSLLLAMAQEGHFPWMGTDCAYLCQPFLGQTHPLLFSQVQIQAQALKLQEQQAFVLD